MIKYSRRPEMASVFNYASMAHNNHFFFNCLVSTLVNGLIAFLAFTDQNSPPSKHRSPPNSKKTLPTRAPRLNR